MEIKGVVGNTEIQTTEGLIPIKDLVGKDANIYCKNEDGELQILPVDNIYEECISENLIKITTSRKILICGEAQLLYTRNGLVRADELKIKDRLIVLNRRMGNEQQVYVSLSGNKKAVSEHRFIAKYFYPELTPQHDVHHLDGNHMNTKGSNLAIVLHSHHSRVTNTGHPDWTDRDSRGKYVAREIKKPKLTYKLGYPPGQIKIISIEKFTGKEILYNIDTENYIANGLVICGRAGEEKFT